ITTSEPNCRNVIKIKSARLRWLGHIERSDERSLLSKLYKEGALDGLGKDGWKILRRTLERWASELGEGVHRIEGNGLLLCGRLWSYKDRNAMG
ncbi:hypothetical protein C0J52_00808, partial [Blattella germanica]